MYYFIYGTYCWIPSLEKSVPGMIKQILHRSGFELVGFYPALGAVSGAGDNVHLNMIVKGPGTSDPLELLDRATLREEAQIEIDYMCWCDPDLARKAATD
jgi:hypothetical protein